MDNDPSRAFTFQKGLRHVNREQLGVAAGAVSAFGSAAPSLSSSLPYVKSTIPSRCRGLRPVRQPESGSLHLACSAFRHQDLNSNRFKKHSPVKSFLNFRRSAGGNCYSRLLRALWVSARSLRSLQIRETYAECQVGPNALRDLHPSELESGRGKVLASETPLSTEAMRR